MYVSKLAINYFLVHSSAEVLKLGIFLILHFGGQASGGRGLQPSSLAMLLKKRNNCCPIRQHSHLIALFEVFHNSGKFFLP